MDDFVTIMILGSSKFDHYVYDDICNKLQEFTADWRETGDYYRYRIIQSGEPGGTAAMARKYAAGTVPPMQDQKNVYCDLKEWRKSKDNGLEMLCLAFLAADNTDDATWKIIKDQIRKGTEIRLY